MTIFTFFENLFIESNPPIDQNLIGFWKSEDPANPSSAMCWRIHSNGPSYIQEFTVIRGSLETDRNILHEYYLMLQKEI